jgi:peroxiredoxin Q/BCP
MTDRLVPGDTAPDFTLPDQDGALHSLAALRGKKVIVYFYPAASTPGCTTEACDFRDNMSSLQAAGYEVLGVSKDEQAKLKTFQHEQALTFPLLSDPDLAVHKAYAAWGEKNNYGKIVTGTIRSTIVVDEDGAVQLPLYNVKATGPPVRPAQTVYSDGRASAAVTDRDSTSVMPSRAGTSSTQPTAATRKTPWNAPIAMAPCRTCQTMMPERTHDRPCHRPFSSAPSQSAAMATRTVRAMPEAMLVAGATSSSTTRTTVTTTSARNSRPTTASSPSIAGDRRTTGAEGSVSFGVSSCTVILQHRNP